MPTLTWIGKEAVVNHHQEVPYHLLRDVPELGCGPADAGNLIVEGDNLTALKALLPYYAGQVKCIYIDPPYNTGNEGWVYNDNVNSPEIKAWLGKVVGKEAEDLSRHDKWLCMMYPRLRLLREFLREDGSIWISMDDSEIHLLRAIADEIFGRQRFVACNVWQKRYSRENREAIGDVHEYLLVYAMNPARFKATRNKIPPTGKQAKVYRNPNNDPRGRWRPIPLTAQAGHATPEQFYEIAAPSGKRFKPSKGRCWGAAGGLLRRPTIRCLPTGAYTSARMETRSQILFAIFQKLRGWSRGLGGRTKKLEIRMNRAKSCSKFSAKKLLSIRPRSHLG